MYVIVTSKPELYTSVLESSATLVATYKYLFYGRCKAIFQIAKLESEGTVTVTEADPPHIVNRVSTKFLEHFDTLEEAQAELNNLTHFGGLNVSLQPCDASEAAA